MAINVFPSEEELTDILAITPSWAYPNRQPYAVVAEGYLTDQQCREINNQFEDEEPYKQPHCGAMTRQLLPPLTGALNLVEDFTLGMNKLYWQYALNDQAVAWRQTYQERSVYPLHTDTYAGQSRKLTAVIMLSDGRNYHGGDLILDTWPKEIFCPRTKGTIVVFQSWHQHEVSAVTLGDRVTVNMGFYGPQFK